MNKKNKKGFWLAEETLKIIVAVIVIIFLAFFLASLYYSNKDSVDKKAAEASLNHLFEQINAQSPSADIYNPKGWVIMSWNDKSNLPASCSNLGWASCICITKDISWTSSLLSSSGLQDKNKLILQQTDEKGICLENSGAYSVEKSNGEGILIENPPVTLSIDYKNKQIS